MFTLLIFHAGIALQTKFSLSLWYANFNLNPVQFRFLLLILMYRSNRSFNMPPPGHLTFLKIIVQIPPCPSQNPTLGSIQVIKCPHPGDISQAHKWQKDGRNAFSCRRKSQWETLLAYLLRTKGSWKAAEIAATRSLNAQLFFEWHATYKIKKNPTYWDYYFMTISLTCIITHLIN